MTSNASHPPVRVGRAVELSRHTLSGAAARPRVTGNSEPFELPQLPFRRERGRRILLELSGAEPGAVSSLAPASTVIGRDAHLAILLRDPTVSFQHARVTFEPDGVGIDDLRSRGR